MNSPDGDAARVAHRGGIGPDPVGVGLLAVGTLLTTTSFTEASAGAWAWGLEATGTGIIGTWMVWEKCYRARGGVPMVDLSLLTIPSFVYGSLAIVVYFLGYTSVRIIVVQYAQAGLGSIALINGFVGVPVILMGSVTTAVAGRRMIRMGRVMVFGGTVLGIAGLLAGISTTHTHTRAGWSSWWLTLTLLMLGMRQDLVVSPNQTLSLADVPLKYTGAAGGILQTGERIGTSVGIAAITDLISHASHSSGRGVVVRVGLLVVVAITAAVVGVAVIGLCLTRRRRWQSGGPRLGTTWRRVSRADGTLAGP